MVMNKTHKGLQVFLDDHAKFRKLAANKGMRMDMLFREILAAYGKKPEVPHEIP